ncbi:MAG: ribosome maturation factor RimP [Candidatus Omnitrophota bacterium]
MDRHALIEELKGMIHESLSRQNFDLVDFIYRYEGRDLFLRIFVDRPEGGISLKECAGLNKEISRMLDEKDILQQRYILEVSSPGLDRPLKTKNDFLRCINKTVKFFLNEAVGGKWEWDGVINKVDEDSVAIDTGQEIIAVPLSKVAKAKQIIGNI